MSTIIKLAAPAALFFQPAEKSTGGSGIREAKLIGRRPNCDHEGRLWKMPARLGFQKVAVIELFVLAVFLVIALAGIVSGFVELSHLLQSDAVGYVAMKAINGSG